MTTLFSNCNNLNQCNSLNNTISPSLSQGTKFNKYNKKFKNSKKKSIYNFVEGFEGEVVSSDEPMSPVDPTSNILTTESQEIVNSNTQVDQSIKIEELRKEYDVALKDYQNLMDKINKNTEDYLKRTKNNQYAGKNIRFTTGHVCYVTQQGVVMHIPNPETWDNISEKNGCPGKNYTDVGIPYPESGIQGTIIKELNLILGPQMKMGQSCNNAGKNVYVNKLLNNPKEKYIGCYNDIQPTTDVLFVPIMNSSNNVNGFITAASSVYQNNNIWGAWTAFNRRDDPYWHSQVSSSNNYNGNTGVYTGTSAIGVNTKNGYQNIKGEWVYVYSPSTAYTLTKYELKGRQGCCGNPNGRSPNSWYVAGWNGSSWNEVDRRENEGLNYEMKSYYISNPISYNAYAIIITNCGNPGDRTGNRYCVQISQWNLYTSSNYVNGINRAMLYEPQWIGYEDMETCKKYASENGYKYFGLQNGKTSESKAACLVSNDLASVRKYGKAYDYKPIVLWHANTTNKGSVALLNNTGSLVVNNSSGAAVWASPDSSGLAGNYYGCYNDCYQGRGLPTHTGWANIDSCRDMAVKNKAKYFGLQWTQSNGSSECWIGNDLERARMMGKAGNCTKLNGNMVGGGCSNAVYATYFDANTIISSFLILQDDGNMCIYRGTSPNDNQGYIWCTSTNGKQLEKNSNFIASKGKYGKNWIPNGTTLAPGEWVGSDNGSIYLIMQSDGNLVLYTNERKDACFSNSKGQIVGGGWVNAVYELQNSGYKDNIGKLAYVDENDVLHEYEKDNTQLTNEYTKVSNFDAYGDDIPGAAYGNATLEQCKSSCDGMSDCYGYVYYNPGNACYPKSSRMWPYGGKSRPLEGGDTYIRNKKPIAVPSGVTDETINIDSSQYQFYNKGGLPDLKYGLVNANEQEQAELERLEIKMSDLTNEINSLINTDSINTNITENQADKNLQGLDDYQTEFEKIDGSINKLNSTSDTSKESFTNYGYTADNNINKIVQESDIIVLQKNYEYLLWTILATGSVLVAMNISKQ
jgi:hypothetical protein